MSSSDACGTAAGDQCGVNMGMIHLAAGDLVGAYRYFQPSAEAGDAEAIGHLITICERAGDDMRADAWRERLPTSS